MLHVTRGSFPLDMNGSIPLPMVKWASNSLILVKAVNAPFSLTLTDDLSMWSINYQDLITEDWRTMGGIVVEAAGGELIVENKQNTGHFWMIVKQVKVDAF